MSAFGAIFSSPPHLVRGLWRIRGAGAFSNGIRVDVYHFHPQILHPLRFEEKKRIGVRSLPLIFCFNPIYRHPKDTLLSKFTVLLSNL
ncbi:hypothetical protein BN1002_04088 [Bacillus sp. B-jedd]|nr:hypothetical protein BN1002_04088 [Bacillus sp. B-jedd]